MGKHAAYAILAAACLGMLFVIALWLCIDSAKPRLVGYGCGQATGPLYADEEDNFPPCDRIEVY